MANEFKVKKGLIVDGTNTVLDIQGTQGQLFSVTDSLTGDLFSVSDISGVPILNVNSSGAVTIDGALTGTSATFADNVAINSTSNVGLTLEHATRPTFTLTDGTNNAYLGLESGGAIITGTTDNDFSIRSPRNVVFGYNGTETAKIDTSGNATFAGDVNVGDDLNIAGNELTFTNDAASAYIRGADALIIESDHDNDDGSSKPIYFYTNGTEMAKMEATVATFAGSVKAATTFIADAIDPGNPSAADGNLRVSGYGVVGNRGAVYLTNASTDSASVVAIGVGGVHGSSTKLTIAPTVSTFATNVTAGTNSLTAGSLDINGAADISGQLAIQVSTSNSQLKLKRTTSATGEFNIFTNNDTLFFNNVANNSYPLKLDASDNAIFTRDITAGSYTRNAQTTLSILTDAEQSSILKFREDNDNYGFTFGYYGSPNNFAIKRNDNSSTGVDVMTIPRNSNNVTFTGEVIAASLDISGNADIDGTLNADGLDIDGNADISGNLTFKPFHYAASADLDSDSRTIWSSHATNGTTSNRPINYSSVYTLGGSATNTLQISTNEDYSESGMWIRQYNQNNASPQGTGWQNWTEVWTTNKISAITDAISTTSSTVVASATAAKAAYDRGSTGVTNAASAQTTANAALPKAGGTMTGDLTLSKSSGDTVLIIESDTDNNNENDNPRLEFKQDGGAVYGHVGTTGNTNNPFTNALVNYTYLRGSIGLQFMVNGTTSAMTIDTSANTVFAGSVTATSLDINGAAAINGKVVIEGDSADWSETTPGLTTGSLHFDPGASTNNFGNAITFGASDTGNGANAHAGIYLRSDGNYGTKMYFATTDNYSSGAKVAMYINKDKDVYFLDDIKVAGEVEGASLDINGNAAIDGLTTLTHSAHPLVVNRTGGAAALIHLQINGTSEGYIGATSTKSFVVYNESAAERFSVSNAGLVTATNDVVAFSDRKLKENIETLDGKKVLDMRGVSFTRKDTGEESSGVIAQEIQKVAPELVHDTEGTLGVAYGNLVGYLIEAVKDQQKQIDELKAMINGNP